MKSFIKLTLLVGCSALGSLSAAEVGDDLLERVINIKSGTATLSLAGDLGASLGTVHIRTVGPRSPEGTIFQIGRESDGWEFSGDVLASSREAIDFTAPFSSTVQTNHVISSIALNLNRFAPTSVGFLGARKNNQLMTFAIGFWNTTSSDKPPRDLNLRVYEAFYEGELVPSPVPEPGQAAACLGLGAGGMVLLLRWRSSRRKNR